MAALKQLCTSNFTIRWSPRTNKLEQMEITMTISQRKTHQNRLQHLVDDHSVHRSKTEEVIDVGILRS